MPILENINKAEQAAEELRLEAEKNSEFLVEKTKEESLLDAKKIVDEANEHAKANNKATLDLISNLEKETNLKIKKDKESLDKKATKNNKAGLDYILDKVFEK